MPVDILNAVLILILVFTILTAIYIIFKDKLHAAILSMQYLDNGGILKSRQAVDYSSYNMKAREKAAAMATAAIILFGLGYIFYRSVFLALLLTPFSFFYIKIRKVKMIEKRKDELKHQFKDAMLSLSSSLYAGKSLESSIRASITDLLIQYDSDSYIIQEFEIIVRKLEANETIEKAFADFAERSHVDEILGFAEVLEICKRNGGNLITAIRSSTEIISDKIEVMNEIQSILAQKKLEQKILAAMPIAIILMLSTSAKDFMEPVFTQLFGRIAMTISLLLFGVAYFISEKITNIEV